MVTRPHYQRGDIVIVGFDPASGHEQKGAGRPALVLSTQAFNQLGTVLVAPITQGGSFARYAGFTVPVSTSDGNVHGVVLVNQLRMLDLHARQAKKVATATGEVIEDVLLRVQAIID
jgi:mRNA interferase ChpB